MTAQFERHYTRSFHIAGLLLSTVVAMVCPPVAQAQETRPRVGLALGGGAARGLAHVGILEWLEEHRIPVDAVAGASMGGLVGGAYAAGRTAGEVRAMVADIDWDRLFHGDVDYRLKSYRRKEDRRRYPVRPELGWRGGLRAAQSLDPGHEVDLLLSRLALPHTLPLDFDDLPTRFRAVATDLERAAVAELGSGSLASALRATMSIPGVFDPVERDSLLLGDGGLLNNVPADAVSRMGVDVVIAVDVGLPLQTREEMRSLLGVSVQALQVMMTERSRSVMSRHADHIITPPLEGISLLGWRRYDTIRAMGYQAAAEAGESLAYLSLSPAAWARHVEARRARRPPPLAELQFVEVTGVDRRSAEEIARDLEPLLGTTPDPDELEFRLTRLAGRGRYGSFLYDVARDGDRTGIVVRARNKPHGPPFLSLALEVEDRTAAGWEASVGTRFTFFDAGSRDAELRLDLSVGPDPDALLDYYLPVAGSPIFVAPRVGFDSRRQWFAAPEDEEPPRYRTRRVGGGADVGVALGRAAELRVGYEAATVVMRNEAGTPLLEDIDGREHGPRVKFVYDGHDDWLLPRRGLRVEVEARRLARAAGQSSGFAEARIRSSLFLPLGRRGRVFLLLGGTTASDDRIGPLYQSTLGGPFRLSAFERDEFRGVRTAHVGAGYLHQLARLPDLVGGPIHGGVWIETGWVETGTLLSEATRVDPAPSFSAGLLADTLLGAVLGSVSIAEGSGPRINATLGRPFW